MLDAGAGRIPHEGPADEAERLVQIASALGRPLLTRGIETLGRAIVDIRGPAVPDPRLVLEVAILRLARRDTGGSSDSLHDRVEVLERQVAELRSGAPERARPAPPSPPEGGPRRALGAFRADRGPESAQGRGQATTTEAGPDASGNEAGSEPGSEPSSTAGAARPQVAESTPPPAAAKAAAPDHDPAGADGVLDLDDVIEVWPAAMGELSPPVRAAIQDAHPIAVEGSVVVFGVPQRRLDAIRNRFQAEADTIRGALAGLLGSAPQFKLRAHDFSASGALAPPAEATTGSAPAAKASRAPTAGSGHGDSGADDEGSDPTDDGVDLTELVDAPADAALFEPTAMLQEQLGAEIVEERPRD